MFSSLIIVETSNALFPGRVNVFGTAASVEFAGRCDGQGVDRAKRRVIFVRFVDQRVYQVCRIYSMVPTGGLHLTSQAYRS